MEFLQTTYFQIAAAVIAVLLVLLLILLIRRRHTTTSDEVRSGFSGAQVSETGAPLMNVQTDRPSFPASTPPEEPSAVPVPRHIQATPPALTTDPLVAAVASMIARPDRLTESDFRRLAIYRPDRVMAAVSSLSSTVGADRHAAAKLEKLVAIRSYLESPAAEATAPEVAILGQEVGSVPTRPMMPENVAGPEVDSQPEMAIPADMEPEALTERPVHAEMMEGREPAPETKAEPALATDLDFAAELAAQAEPEPASAVTEPQAEITEGETPMPSAPHAPSPWQDAGPAPEGPAPETAPAPSPPPVPEPEPELAAEQFLQLPESHRAAGLHRLSAAELGTALRGSQGDDVKLQIIDRLEELGTPEALLALEEFLGNADSPQTQLYALSAAERLLGGGAGE